MQSCKLLQYEQSSECAWHGGCGEAEIAFYCLQAGDPMLKRPALRAGPNQRIEMDQKQGVVNKENAGTAGTQDKSL